MKTLLACAALLHLAACGVGPGITANDSGGIIPYAFVAAYQDGAGDRTVAQQMASDHCARYGKYAVITSMHRQYGDYVGFNCR